MDVPNATHATQHDGRTRPAVSIAMGNTLTSQESLSLDLTKDDDAYQHVDLHSSDTLSRQQASREQFAGDAKPLENRILLPSERKYDENGPELSDKAIPPADIPGTTPLRGKRKRGAVNYVSSVSGTHISCVADILQDALEHENTLRRRKRGRPWIARNLMFHASKPTRPMPSMYLRVGLCTAHTMLGAQAREWAEHKQFRNVSLYVVLIWVQPGAESYTVLRACRLPVPLMHHDEVRALAAFSSPVDALTTLHVMLVNMVDT